MAIKIYFWFPGRVVGPALFGVAFKFCKEELGAPQGVFWLATALNAAALGMGWRWIRDDAAGAGDATGARELQPFVEEAGEGASASMPADLADAPVKVEVPVAEQVLTQD